MNLPPAAKVKIHQNLARRINALGGDVGDIDTITHDERSLLRLLDAMIGLVEKLTKVRA